MGEVKTEHERTQDLNTRIADRINRRGTFLTGSREDMTKFLGLARSVGYSENDAFKLLSNFFDQHASPNHFLQTVEALKVLKKNGLAGYPDLQEKVDEIVKELSKEKGDYKKAGDRLVDVLKEVKSPRDAGLVIDAMARESTMDPKIYARAVINLAEKHSFSAQISAGLAAAGVKGEDITSAINALKDGDPAQLMGLIAKNPDVKSSLPKSMQDARDSAAFIDAIAGLDRRDLTDLGDKVRGVVAARATAAAAQKAAAEAAAKQEAEQAGAQKKTETDVEAARKFCADLDLPQLEGPLTDREGTAAALVRSILRAENSSQLYKRCEELAKDPRTKDTPSGQLAAEIRELIDGRGDNNRMGNAARAILGYLTSSKDLPGLLSGISDYQVTATTTTAAPPAPGAGTGVSAQLQQKVTELCNKQIDAAALSKLGIPADKYETVIKDLSDINSGKITAANVDAETRKVLHYLCKKGVDGKYEATNQAISEQELADATAAFKFKVGMSPAATSRLAKVLGPQTLARLCRESRARDAGTKATAERYDQRMLKELMSQKGDDAVSEAMNFAREHFKQAHPDCYSENTYNKSAYKGNVTERFALTAFLRDELVPYNDKVQAEAKRRENYWTAILNEVNSNVSEVSQAAIIRTRNAFNALKEPLKINGTAYNSWDKLPGQSDKDRAEWLAKTFIEHDRAVARGTYVSAARQ